MISAEALQQFGASPNDSSTTQQFGGFCSTPLFI